ncbi:MAG: exodeoxyribonuclease VII small subunit [Candidatus Saccharimonadales bacterium]|jgi:exodeoxyribonuclease VII small subunit
MAKNEINYQELSNELDILLAKLQDPATNLDDAMSLYKRGRVIIKELETYLKQAENTVRTLSAEKAES